MRVTKPYTGYYQTAYWLLIAFMLLLVVGIVLIYREVRGAARNLGTTFITFGIVGLSIYFIAKYFVGSQLANIQDLPAILQTWLPQFLNDFMMPELIIGVVFAVLGLVLIIVSMLYKLHQGTPTSAETKGFALPAA